MRRVRAINRISTTVILSAVILIPQIIGAGTPSTAPLLDASSLVYQGAFRVPGGRIGTSTFEYGGTALTYNPTSNSLFIVGHDADQDVAEMSIPAAKTGAIAGLNTATVLQPFADGTDGRMGAVGSGTTKVGGLLPYQGKLFESVYLYYDGTGSQVLSHFVGGLTLSVAGDAKGPYQVGTLGAGFVSGYFGLVPSEWQTALGGPVLNGQCCLPIISRTSYGPAVFTIDPMNIGVTSPVPASALVYYPSSHPLLDVGAKGDGWSNTSTLFNGTTEIRGVVFPQNTRSVLFFGRHGIGTFCYGPGTSDPALAGKPAPGGVDVYCYDPADSSKGTHAYPYVYYVWAYDANDLASVKAGTKQPYDARPYAVWQLSLPYASDSAHLNGAAYDPSTGRIFLSQGYGDGVLPVIHVLSVGAPSSAPPSIPTAPNPATGSNTGVKPTLTWSSSGALTYAINLGTASPPPQVAAGVTTASYAPATLAGGATYYWQIVATNAAGSTAGPVWSFKTSVAPAAPTNVRLVR